MKKPNPAAARSEVCVCGCLLAGIAGANPAGEWLSSSCGYFDVYYYY